MRISDLTNKRFGRLVAEVIVGKNKCGQLLWRCICDCGNSKTIVGTSLTKGVTNSCGCLRKEISSINLINTYDLTGYYGIGYTSKNEEFYFDLEDYNKIKDFYWWINDSGYIITQKNRKTIRMHRLITGIRDDLQIDHIYHNKNDNRKENLREVTNQQNSMNKDCIGVYWNKEKNKWDAKLKFNNKSYLKRFNSYEDALEYRCKLEDKFFGEYKYSPSE